MKKLSQPVKSLEWKNNVLIFIDQTALPHSCDYITTSDYRDIIEAIKILKIRGAPAIGIAAAYAAVLAAIEGAADTIDSFDTRMKEALSKIESARPTARNLFFAVERMKSILAAANRQTPQHKIQMMQQEADRLYNEDSELCLKIGKYGSQLIRNGDTIITHCNTGMLVTTGIGTALGVLYTAHSDGKDIHVYADETRPLLQGARLTTWECGKMGIPVTLICDGAAAEMIRRGKINSAIVGADRIAANGDVANKIGTYSLALCCNAHEIPFYVAAPYTTFDFSLETGNDIEIEQRDEKEIKQLSGVLTAPENVTAFNPAFDITPWELITAIITDKGIFKPPFTDWGDLRYESDSIMMDRVKYS
jgi:methylthioribose-1-phosphate isomerase